MIVATVAGLGANDSPKAPLDFRFCLVPGTLVNETWICLPKYHCLLIGLDWRVFEFFESRLKTTVRWVTGSCSFEETFSYSFVVIPMCDTCQLQLALFYNNEGETIKRCNDFGFYNIQLLQEITFVAKTHFT